MTNSIDLKVLKNNSTLWLHLLPKVSHASNKYTRGYTLIVGGYPITGAARLSAYSAARIGSGLTSLLVPEIAFSIYASSLTSIMVRPFDNLNTFKKLIQDSRISCFLIGPGAGASDETRRQSIALFKTGKPVVVDADAISGFEGDLVLLKKHINPHCVLTPHEGEFKRLFNLSDNRVLSARNAAKECGAVVVLKGSDSVIAGPDGRVIVNYNAPPSLATAGSGDVLAGIIAGLIAQGMSSFFAAAAATWMHAQAAELFGAGLIAEDLPMCLGPVLKTLTKKTLKEN